MKPGLETSPLELSAFAIYKAEQKKLKKKKKKNPKVPMAIATPKGKKVLRSAVNGKKLKLPVAHDTVNRPLTSNTNVLRNRKPRKVSKAVKKQQNVQTNKSKRVKSLEEQLGQNENIDIEAVENHETGKTSSKRVNEEDSSKEKSLPDANNVEKDYEMRILGRRSPVPCSPSFLYKRLERRPSPLPEYETPPPVAVGPSSYYDSVEEGRKLLAWLIEPVPLEEFFSKYWLQEPLLVQRNQPNWYQHLLLSSGSLDAMLRNNHLQYSKNVDVTSYENGVRETHNDLGRALPSQIWDFYNNGCSIRWLNPQAYSNRLWLFNSTLQELFSGMVGANVYLTPPDSQGFAPHFDDIEAFVLQLEGKKHWKLYHPSVDDKSPRFSSRNFKPDEIGEPFMEVTLQAGDLLYFPRGVVHQATATDSHSLHVTISCYQHNTWADLLEKAVPAALSKAISEDPAFRESLPLGHQDYVGSNCKEMSTEKRTVFDDKVRDLVAKVLDRLPIDEAVDDMGKNFMAEALPPCLLADEVRCSVYGSKMCILAGGRVAGSSGLQMMDDNTRIKLVRRHCLRLVYESNGPQVYFTSDNTCESQEVEQQSLELTHDLVPAIAKLIYNYPKYLKIEELPLADPDAKITFAFNLWEKGLLLTKTPLNDSSS